MKVVLLGDTHFGARNDSPIFHDYFSLFYRECFFPYLQKHGIKHVIQLGDVFDRRKYINFLSLKKAREYFFDPLAKLNISVDLIVGNHDTYFKNTNEVNSLNLLLKDYKFNLWRSPTEVGIDGISFLLVPWINTDNHAEAIEAMKLSKASYVIGHFEIQGFEMYKGAVNDVGLTADTFKNFEGVFSGHFHHKSTKGNITYVGTPYEMTWSDFNDPKGFHVFDTSTRDIEFVENPFRMFHKLWYDDREKTMEQAIEYDYGQYSNKIIKMIVTAKTNPYWFDVVIDRLEKVGVADLQVVEDHFHLDIENDDDIISDAEDTLTILNKVVQQTNTQTDKERLDKLIKDLYNEALTME